MFLKKIFIGFAWLLFAVIATGCLFNPPPQTTVPFQTDIAEATAATPAAQETPADTPSLPPAATPTLAPARLTVCLGREPASLFPYTAASSAARAVLSAIYPGSFAPGENLNNLDLYALEGLPTLESGEMQLLPMTVEPGAPIVDSTGELAALTEGVRYRPSGCTGRACELVYSAGLGAVQMDQWVLHYTLRSGLTWSDGEPVTASDSLYGYEVARGLYPAVQAGLLARTAGYTAIDERTLEWRGLPGYQDGDANGKFFPPLPRHTWEQIAIQDLPAAEAASRAPLGWGPYVVQEWRPAESILLRRSPAFTPGGEGLPYFDEVLFRFIPDAAQGYAALQAGECDLLDPAAQAVPALQELSADVQVFRQPASWTQLLFGLLPADGTRPAPFANPAVRQAAALCIDRAAVAQAAGGVLLEAYVPAGSPYFNAQAVLPEYDPASAAPLLTNAGWVDGDADPATPRTNAGGAPFAVSLLVAQDSSQQAAAEAIQQGLASCGIQVTVESRPAEEVLAPGPEGPIFGRSFDLALFAWPASDVPPCRLFLSREIPGAYPASPLGWGGANASGYNRPEYDLACTSALTALPGSEPAAGGYAQAQALLAQDLPMLPLYGTERTAAARPELCHLAGETGWLDWSSMALWSKGDDCTIP